MISNRIFCIISIFIYLLSCNSNNQLNHATTNDLFTEEDIETRRGSIVKDIGTTPSEILQNLKTVKNYNDLLSYIKDRGKRNNRKARKLDFDYFQVVEDIWSSNHLRVNLAYLLYKDSISIIKLNSIDSNYVALHKSELIYTDPALAMGYLNKHNQKYSTNKNELDIEKELLDTMHTVRFACGHAGNHYGPSERKTIRSIKQKDTEKLYSLLTSLNPEMQTLGLLGMLRLKELGSQLDKKTLDIIQHLKQRNTSIKVCVACSYKYYKLSKYLDAYDWKEIFESNGA